MLKLLFFFNQNIQVFPPNCKGDCDAQTLNCKHQIVIEYLLLRSEKKGHHSILHMHKGNKLFMRIWSSTINLATIIIQ